ncbi:MAG TPA: chromosomal replication initiator protein DnaA [bacterium]
METIWQKVQNSLKTKLPHNIYNEWFSPLSIQSIEGGEVVLTAPSEMHVQWIGDNYLDTIKDIFFSITSKKYNIRIAISGQVKTRAKQQERFLSPYNPNLTFETFVVGHSNQLAHAASLAVAKNPGYAYNPLFIFGGVGLGKTHLLNAIANFVLKNKPGLNVLLMSSETFMNEFIKATAHGKMNDFRSKFRETCDLLMIDDIEFFAGKERTQEEFFHTFNTLSEAKKQIILTSDKYPKEIPHMEERLRSRVESGVIVDIQPPDYETKIAILKKRAEKEKVSMPDEVYHFLASLNKSNIRDLYGYFNTIKAYSEFKSVEITLSLVKETLKGFIVDKKVELTVDDVLKFVADYFNIKVADMKSARRMRSIAFPRQIAMYIARTKLSYSFPELGEKFGGKDHSTIIHGVKKIEKKIANDDGVKSIVNQICKKLDEK